MENKDKCKLNILIGANIMFFNKNRPKDIWESVFQDISASEVYLAKK